MTELEFAQFYALVQDLLYMQFLVINTVIVAYLVAGHLVGSKLPNFLMLSITSIYCMFIAAPFYVYWQEYGRLHSLSMLYHAEYPGGFVIPLVSSQAMALFTMVPMLLAWAGTIYYVQFYVRSVSRSGS